MATWRAALVAWYAFALAAWCEADLGDGPDSLRELFADPSARKRPHPAE